MSSGGIWIILVFSGYFGHSGIFKVFWRFRDYLDHFRGFGLIWVIF